MHSIINSQTKVGINEKHAIQPLDNNYLTTFLFDKVLERMINNVSKKIINLMIIQIVGLSILFNYDNHLAPPHVFSS